MNGIALVAERFGLSLTELLRAARHRRARHHHRRQHDDRDGRRAHRPARHRAGTATRSRCAGSTRRRSGTRRTRRRSRSPGAGPASRSRSAWTIRARSCWPSTRTRCAQGVRRLRRLGVTSIAVMFLFSFVNPDHERRAAEIIREEFPDVEHISLSHEVMARGPEFERVSTTLVNAYVAPRIASYVEPPPAQAPRPRATRASCSSCRRPVASCRPTTSPAARSRCSASGPTGGVMGAALAAGRAGRRRLRRRRHGRHQLRPLPGPRRAARDQDRLELALPLLHRPADGGRAERRRRRRLDRPGAPGCAARRARERGLGPGAGLLRPRRGAPDGDRRRRGARLPARRRLRRWPHDPRHRRVARGDRARGRRPARPRRRRGRVGHRADRQRQHGRTRPGACSPVTAPITGACRSSPTAATVPCTRGRSRRSSAWAGSSCRRRRRRSPRSGCSWPTTSSTWCARTSCRCRRWTSAGCAS